MNFLKTALFDKQSQELSAVITFEFNPENLTERAHNRFITVDELISDYDKLSPSGWSYEDGLIYSDTDCRRVVSNNAADYMADEYKRLPPKELDITDVILYGVKYGGCVIANPLELLDIPDDLEEECGMQAVRVPLKNMRVSNSSFNIYASYFRDFQGFRTYSMLNVEDGSAKENVVCFPIDVDLSVFGDKLTKLRIMQADGVEWMLYKTNLGLVGLSEVAGEGFLNYLAYNVAYYSIGEKVLKLMFNSVNNVQKPGVSTEDSSTVYYGDKRRPEVNVSIVHEYKRPYINEVVAALSDAKALQELFVNYPESTISYQWLHAIYKSPWYLEGVKKGSTPENALYDACANLHTECQKNLLRFALELVSQRYNIYLGGFVNDTTPSVIEGGGVCGKSFKSTSF